MEPAKRYPKLCNPVELWGKVSRKLRSEIIYNVDMILTETFFSMIQDNKGEVSEMGENVTK